MELPQSRSFGTEGREPTHDFLSLYGHSTVPQDPRPPSQGGFLKTHDFLQVGKINTKEESTVEISSTVEKPPPSSSTSSVEHILPGGIGTYSISHISYFAQKVPKPEGTIFTVAQTSSAEKYDENSNCSSYPRSGFTLWEDSNVKKGKKMKESARKRPIARETTVNVGRWPSQSSSNNNSHRNSFRSLSCSESAGLKSKSFMEMIKSAKCITHDDDLDDDEEFILKKENSTTTTTTTHKGELGIKVDGKSNDQKPNTPRSKHSATEQRRRSKINDRFQMLREVIPHSDQKRDKASFLLEVIEYIQFLQEKVHKYEGPQEIVHSVFTGWNQEAEKLAPWRNNHKPAESYGEQSLEINNGSATALVFAAKLDEKKVAISPAVESDMSITTMLNTVDHQPGIANKAMPFPISLESNCYNPVRNGGGAPPLQPRLASDAAENMTSEQPQPPISHTRSCTGDIAISNDKLKEQKLTVEGGTINISTVYSQGLLNTLTRALQSSGVDLSQASISVQIELGKRGTGRSIAPVSTNKDNEVLASIRGTTCSRDENGCEDSNQVLRKQKTDKS